MVEEYMGGLIRNKNGGKLYATKYSKCREELV